jgi:hypothetical protein
MEINFEVQIRHENGGLRFFPNLKEAVEFAKNDASVWKISFSLPNGERVRMIRETSQVEARWMYDPIILPEE